MSSIGWTGIAILALVLLLVFGPRQLPKLGRQLGHGMREFKDTVGQPASEIRAALDAPREARAALNPGTQLKEALAPGDAGEPERRPTESGVTNQAVADASAEQP